MIYWTCCSSKWSAPKGLDCSRAEGERVVEPSSDIVILRAFAKGSTEAASNHLHIEHGVLYALGWWTLAIRLDANVFLVRADSHSATIDHFADELEALLRSGGLVPVDRDPPLADVATFQAASLIGASWQVWACDTEHAREALGRWAQGTQEAAAPGEPSAEGLERSVRLQLEVARRMVEERSGHLPPPRVLLLDVEPVLIDEFKAQLPGCEMIQASTQTTTCAEIGSLAPTVVVVDVDRAGQEMILALRATCGRFLSIVALRGEGMGGVLGADAVITRPFTADALAAALRNCLPSE